MSVTLPPETVIKILALARRHLSIDVRLALGIPPRRVRKWEQIQVIKLYRRRKSDRFSSLIRKKLADGTTLYFSFHKYDYMSFSKGHSHYGQRNKIVPLEWTWEDGKLKENDSWGRNLMGNSQKMVNDMWLAFGWRHASQPQLLMNTFTRYQSILRDKFGKGSHEIISIFDQSFLSEQIKYAWSKLIDDCHEYVKLHPSLHYAKQKKLDGVSIEEKKKTLFMEALNDLIHYFCR